VGDAELAWAPCTAGRQRPGRWLVQIPHPDWSGPYKEEYFSLFDLGNQWAVIGWGVAAPWPGALGPEGRCQ
jgi:hypothetical protein